MSEQVDCTTSLYLRADDSPDGALARLADVVRHVTKARAIPWRDAAVQVAQVLGRRWGVEFAFTRDDLLKRERDFAATASSADDSDDDSWDRFFYGDGYCHWMADQMSLSQLFQASEVGYGVVLPKEYKQLEPPKRCGDGALRFHRTHLDGVMPLPPVAWIHEVWGTLIEKDSELDQGPAAAWCIRASLAAELFGYGTAASDSAESVPAQVLSLVTSSSSPEDRRRKMAEACERIGQPVRKDDGKISWKSPATCRTFLDAVNALAVSGYKQDDALNEIGKRWGVVGSGLKKKVTECRETLRAGDRGRAVQSR